MQNGDKITVSLNIGDKKYYLLSIKTLEVKWKVFIMVELELKILLLL